MGDTEGGVDGGEDELQPQTGQDRSIDDRGVHRSLHDGHAAEVAQGQASDVVALRCSVGEEPRAAGAPCFCGEGQCLLQRAWLGRSRLRQVHALGEHWDVHREHPWAGERGQGPVPVGLVLVPRDAEPDPVTFRIAVEGVGVGGRGHIGHGSIQSFGSVRYLPPPGRARRSGRAAPVGLIPRIAPRGGFA